MQGSGNVEKDARNRLYGLLDLQKKVEAEFGENEYNVFVFGSYITTQYVEGESDVDIAIYSENFDLYKRLACYLEDYFGRYGVKSDIFYIDTTMEAPVYCAPLRSEIQFTDYYPKKLKEFREKCQRKLEVEKARAAG